MRIPSPTPVRLSQRALRDEAQARLGERLPAGLARLGDPTDPGWLLIEEAAWRVETISEEAGRVSDALVVQTLGALGASTLPPCPAVGLLLVEAADHGELTPGEDEDAVLFRSAHTEARAGLALVMLETRAPVVAGRLSGSGGQTGLSLSPCPERASLALPSPTAGAVTLRLCLELAAGAPGTLQASAGGRVVTCSPTRRIKGLAEAELAIVEVPLPRGVSAVSLTFDAPRPASVGLNPVLVINAPRLHDGRIAALRAAGLLRADAAVGEVLSRRALDPLLGRGIDDLIECLPLWRVQALARATSTAVEGDPASGALLVRHEAGPSARVEVAWVRQTDGAAGALAAGEVRVVEQPREAQPRLTSVLSPYPLRGGRDRESASAAVQRTWPRGVIPVVEFQPRMGEALAAAGLDWRLRLWTSSDGRMNEARTWAELDGAPAGGGGEVKTARELLQPGVLLAVTGPRRGALSVSEYQRAEQVLQRWYAAACAPHLRLRGLVVCPLRTLTLKTQSPGRGLDLPSWSTSGLGSSDRLIDHLGESRPPTVGGVPLDGVLLDGLITSVARGGGAG